MAVTAEDLIHIDYDEEVDVLYVSFGSAEAALSVQLPERVDVFLRYVPPAPDVTGVFILDFLRHFPKPPTMSMLMHALVVVADILRYHPKIP